MESRCKDNGDIYERKTDYKGKIWIKLTQTDRQTHTVKVKGKVLPRRGHEGPKGE
jgi:hypothetical protein